MNMNHNELRKYRKSKGITIKELSKNIGVSVSYLSLVERGLRKTNRDMVEIIKEKLDKKEVDYNEIKTGFIKLQMSDIWEVTNKPLRLFSDIKRQVENMPLGRYDCLGVLDEKLKNEIIERLDMMREIINSSDKSVMEKQIVENAVSHMLLICRMSGLATKTAIGIAIELLSEMKAEMEKRDGCDDIR